MRRKGELVGQTECDRTVRQANGYHEFHEYEVEMTLFIIVVCGVCGRPSVGSMSQKSRRCPYCGNRINLMRARIVAKAASAEDARVILAKEKERLYQIRKTHTTPRFRPR